MDAQITTKPKAKPLRNGAWICYGDGRTAGGMHLAEAFNNWRWRTGPSAALYVQMFGRARRGEGDVCGPTIAELTQGGAL